MQQSNQHAVFYAECASRHTVPKQAGPSLALNQGTARTGYITHATGKKMQVSHPLNNMLPVDMFNIHAISAVSKINPKAISLAQDLA